MANFQGLPALSKRVPACFTWHEGWVLGGMLSFGNFRDQGAETMKMETVNIGNHEILTINHTEAMMTFSLKKMQFRTCCTVRWTGSLAYLNSSKSACHGNCGTHRSRIAGTHPRHGGNKQANRLTWQVTGLDWRKDFGFGDQTLHNIQYTGYSIPYDHILFFQTELAGWVESWDVKLIDASIDIVVILSEPRL